MLVESNSTLFIFFQAKSFIFLAFLYYPALVAQCVWEII